MPPTYDFEVGGLGGGLALPVGGQALVASGVRGCDRVDLEAAVWEDLHLAFAGQFTLP